MMQRRWFVVLTFGALAFVLAAACPAATPTPRPEGTLTVAVATFGNERWLPSLMRRWRITGVQHPISSGWYFSRGQNPPPAWPCYGREASMSSKSVGSTWRS
jgi:hypothetical protein